MRPENELWLWIKRGLQTWLNRYALLMEDEMAAGAFGRAKNYGRDDCFYGSYSHAGLGEGSHYLICSFACKLFSLSSKLIASRLPLHFYLCLISQVQSPSCHCFFVYWYIWMLMTLTVKMHWKTSDQHTHSSSISRTDLATISSTWRTNLRDSSGNGAGRLFLHWRSWLCCVWVSKACRRAPHSTTSGTKKR